MGGIILRDRIIKDKSLKEVPCGQDVLFPVSILQESYEKTGILFSNHWHDHIEFLYMKSGEGIFECNHVPYRVKPGDLIVVNSGELHCGYSITNAISYYCIIVDPVLMQSSFIDICDLKYIAPITQNRILFKNRIVWDKDIIESIHTIINEYENKRIGYELSIKSCINRMLVLLLRGHECEMLSPVQYEGRKREMERLALVFKHIEKNYAGSITGNELARLVNVSPFHFRRLFKKMTSVTITQYVNNIRIQRAADLLYNTDVNITEAALASGFSDVNYFTRQFRKLMGITPSGFRKR